MAGKARVTVTGDAASAIKEYDKLSDKVQELTKKLKESGSAGKKSGADTGGAFAAGTKQAIGFASALTGIGTATSLVIKIANQLKAEYENLVRKQREALDAQISYSDAIVGANRSRPIGLQRSTAEIVKEISDNSNMLQRDVALSLGPTYSSMGTLTEDQMIEASSVSAKMSMLEGKNSFDSSGVMGVMERIPGISAKQAFGFLNRFHVASKITDPVAADEAANKVLANLTEKNRQYGWNAENMMEYLGTFTQLGVDKGGKASATLFNRVLLLSGSGQFLLPTEGNKPGTYGKKRVEAKGPAAMKQMADWVKEKGRKQEDLDEFIRINAIPSESAPTMTGLMEGSKGFEDTLRGVEAQIPSPTSDASSAVYNNLISKAEKSRAYILRETRQKTAKSAEASRLSRDSSVKQSAREVVQSALKESGILDIEDKWVNLQFEKDLLLGKDPYETGERLMNELQRKYVSKTMPYQVRGVKDEAWRAGQVKPGGGVYGYATEIPAGAVRTSSAWDIYKYGFGKRDNDPLWMYGEGQNRGSAFQNPAYDEQFSQSFVDAVNILSTASRKLEIAADKFADPKPRTPPNE